ncbi:MAG: hypothetical protein LOX97_04570 [Sphingomonas sp.]|nr:hypothetical protein [Sphingomonas sp.]
MMIKRRIEAILRERLAEVPAVALLGPRQVGKTTMALTSGCWNISIGQLTGAHLHPVL